MGAIHSRGRRLAIRTACQQAIYGEHRCRHRWYAFLAVGIVAGACQPAFAQQDSAAPADSGTAVLGEIVVTARKRAETLAEIPDQIDAFTAATIEDAGIDSIEDVTLQIANFSLVKTQNPGTAFLNLRGIGQYRNSEPPVAIVVDGVQLVSTDAITQELYDIQQIEVLKGPQGALYGRNAAAGAINITTKKPTNELEGLVEVTYGNGDDARARMAVSGPIVDGYVFARLSGSGRKSDGVIDNVTTGAPADFYDDRNLRLRVLAEPSNGVTIDLRASYAKLDAGSSYFIPIIDPNGFALDGVANDFSFPVQTDTEGASERELQEYALKLDFQLGSATLTSISALTRTNETFFQDLDFTAAPVLNFGQARDVDAWSEELRLSSSSEGRWHWMVGAYYLDSERLLTTDVYAALANIGLYTDPAFSGGTLSLFDFDRTATADTRIVDLDNLEDNAAWAAFANFSLDITDAWQLTVGIRYDVDERKQIDLNTGEVLRKTFDLPQPKIQLAYHPTDTVNFYGSWGRGFRSGGFNQDDVVRASFDAEEVSTAELGFKSQWLSDRLTVNGAVFLTEFTNRQDFLFVLGAQTVLTLPEAEIRGAELEIAYEATDALSLFAGVGLLDTEVQSEAIGFDPTLTGLPAGFSFVGHDIPLAYGWSYTLAAQYSQDVAGHATLVGRLDYSAQGDMAWELGNEDRQEAVHLLNARASLEFDSFEVTAWIENVLDTEYYQEFVAREFSALATDLGFPGSPRRYGITLTHRF